MAVQDDDMIVNNRDYLVTESALNPKASAEEIASFLRRHHVTGTATTHLFEGGVQRILVTEKALAKESRRNKLRETLDMPVTPA